MYLLLIDLFLLIFRLILHENYFRMESKTFGELIREQRVDLGKPIREVAGDIRLDQSLLSKIERNKLRAPSRIISPLSKSLGMDYGSLQQKYWSERIYNELKEEDYALEALELALRRLEKDLSGTVRDMGREDLIRKIRTYADGKPIDKVWIFGSFARGEASLDSDIDLLVKFDHSFKIDLFDYIGMRQDLEDLTGRQVDLVEEGQELPRIRPIIDQEKRLIYEREVV